jgi:RNA polymerase-binding transcription factor DksA/ribosome-associated translation inhibitor RaiA
MRTPLPTATAPWPPIELRLGDEAPSIVESYARTKLRRLVRVAPAPVVHVALRVAATAEASDERRWAARATMDVDGRLVRAHAMGATAIAAVDVAQERLHDQLVRLGERQRRERRSARSWRAPETSGVPGRSDRSDGERVLVRRTTLSPADSTLDEAIFDLEMLDADFLLFREVETGADAVVHHRDDGRLGLVRHDGTAPDAPVVTCGAEQVVLEPPPPTLGTDAAMERLELSGEPFVVIAEPATDRAMVVHRRGDGAYGLVVPVDAPASLAEPSIARRRLVAELRRLQAVQHTLWGEGLDAMTECQDVSELSGADQHPADLGTETFERARDLSLLHEVDAEVEAVRHALLRLAQGTYGRCDSCGVAIPDERLVVVPAARFCVAHQAEAEADRG